MTHAVDVQQHQGDVESPARPWWRPPEGGAELRAWRLRVYPRAAVLAPLLAFITVMVQAARNGGERLGGDLPAFYGAGRIARAGDWANLYDYQRQVESQSDALADLSGGILPFAYAPPVAAAYAPLAGLEYHVAFVVHTVAMVGFFIAGLWILRPFSALLQRQFLPVATAAFFFIPMFRAIVGGQNTAFTFFLLAATIRLLADDHEFALILPFTMMLYKPQVALPVMGLCVIARRWRAVAAAVVAVVTFWVLGALVAGPDWFGYWWESVITFGTAEDIATADINVSFRGVLADVMGTGLVSELLGWSIVLATIVLLVQMWRPEAQLSFEHRWVALVPALILISPHAMFYEAGILIIAALIAYEQRFARAPFLIGLWLYGWVELTPIDMGVHVIFPLVLSAFVAAIVWLGQPMTWITAGWPSRLARDPR